MDAHGDVPLPAPQAPLPPPVPPRAGGGVVSLTRFIVDRNPFFLLSAVMMFVGVRVVVSALHLVPGDLKHLLLLIGVLNAYEAAVIALALFLITRRGLRRDGWLLLSIEGLFLVDLTFLNAELFTANLRWGSAINALCFALALAKVGVVVRTLRLRLAPSEWAYVAVQFAAIFFMAGVFKRVANHDRHPGTLSAMVLYEAWWLIGALLLAATFLLRKPAERRRDSAASAMWQVTGRLYLVLPFVSMVVHLIGANRVYWVHFHPANAAPLFLGLAVLLTRWRGDWSRAVLTSMQCALAGLAVIVSMGAPAELNVSVVHHAVSPLRLALLGSSGVMFAAFFHSLQLLAFQVATAATIAAMLGNSLDEMKANAWAFVRAIVQTLRRLVPETEMQWGVLAIVGAFVMLALGAVVSLRKRPARGAESAGEVVT